MSDKISDFKRTVPDKVTFVLNDLEKDFFSETSLVMSKFIRSAVDDKIKEIRSGK